jgi:hypothetical protein
MKQDCRCLCGAARVAVSGEPIVRLLCHCTICQKVYNQPCSDVTVFWSRAVALPKPHGLRFQHYRPPPALNRGTCANCAAPMVGLMVLGPLSMAAFLPSQNFPKQDELPRPTRRIFYDRRVADIADDLPRLEGYWRSNAFVFGTLLAALAGRSPST